MTSPKTVAGLHCFEVLGLLDDFVAHELEDEIRTRVHAHLAQCKACSSFGTRYASLVTHLQRDLISTSSTPPLTPEDFARNLLKRHEA